MTAAVRQLVRDGCKMHPRLGPSAWPVWSEYRPSSQLRRPAGPACNARSGYHLDKVKHTAFKPAARARLCKSSPMAS